jgi:hypothetical protein
MVMAEKLTRLTQKIAIQLHLVAENLPFAVLAPGGQSGNFWIHPRMYATQPPIQSVLMAHPPGVKRPGREADYSPTPSTEVKNAWSYTSTPPNVFMTWCLINHMGKFTFTFLRMCMHRTSKYNTLPIIRARLIRAHIFEYKIAHINKVRLV